jgi:low temperature requirement protein LtrA
MAEQTAPHGLIRERAEAAGRQRVTTMELFFDLVFVFAITQLSGFILGHRTLSGVLQAALLLAMVWLLWAYTTWLTNWFDPDRIPVRLLLLALMLVSLVMSAALPEAFRSSGLLVGGAYAVMAVLSPAWPRVQCCGWPPWAWTCSVAGPASTPLAWAGRRPGNGTSRAVTSLSAARPSS